MKVSEFKKITDALARFATTREKATGPKSLIGVQLRGETLKLISGNEHAGMVCTVEGHDSEPGKETFLVPSRPLLQAAKVLPAKSDISIVCDAAGLHIIAPGGGSFDVGRIDRLALSEAGFAKKPKVNRVKGRLDAKTLKRMSKLFKAVAAKVEVPSVQIVKGVGYAVVAAPGNRSSYANVSFTAESRNGEEDELSMAGYRDFWDALTHFTEDSILGWDLTGIMLESGNIQCFSAPYLTSTWDPETRKAGPPEPQVAWPILVATEESDVAFTIERRTLIESVKGQAPFDELNRITLEVNTDSVRVMPFGSSNGIDLPAEAQGKGFRSVNADYLLPLLNAIDAKMVTLRWSGGVPAVSISAEDYDSWTILLAPVTL